MEAKIQTEPALTFGPYRLEGPHGPLVRRSQIVNLPPKALAVLWALATQAGRVVTKETLLETVWPETVVGEDALVFQIQTLRQALNDNARRPRHIETVHRVGYRFVAAVTAATVPSSKFRVPSFPPSPVLILQHPTPALVGRDAELAQLHGWLDKAVHGCRQIVFVTGEPGIGKTSLLEAFVSEVRSPRFDVRREEKRQKAKVTDLRSPTPVPWIAQGQCIEHFGAGEAYLPVLAALGQLGQEPGGERLVALLDRYAPTWLVQMPALLSPTNLDALQRKTLGATRERMLREMAEAVEALTSERPLVLVLEDLHWSDYSTLELLSFLARRRQPARLLVLGTYRPVEVIVREHPLKVVEQELHLHDSARNWR